MSDFFCKVNQIKSCIGLKSKETDYSPYCSATEE